MNKKTQKININCKKAFLIAFSFAIAFYGKSVFANTITRSEVIKLVNDARNLEGLDNVLENPILNKAAEEKAQDMLTYNYFSHTSPAGINPWYWIEKNNYDYHYAGENLAINFESSEDQQQAWMNSISHRKNILNSKYIETGVAVVQGNINENNSIITVQIFAAPMEFVYGATTVRGNDLQDNVQLLSQNNYKFEDVWKMNIRAFLFWIIIMTPMIFYVAGDTLRIMRKREIRSMFIVKEIKIH